jgi:hypothetical protein
MPKDSLRDFTALRRNLETERQRIAARLDEINAALGSTAAPVVAITKGRPATKRAGTKRTGRGGNTLSLKEAVVQATTGHPLTKDEIFQAVKKLGYNFTTQKPRASINVALYGKSPKFKNQDGRFSPV